MASLVVSVISRFVVLPSFRCAAWQYEDAGSYQEPDGVFPGALEDDECFAVSRQAATTRSSASGLKGFCRLLTAPSLVAIVRKSGPGAESNGIAWPEITTIWTEGYCCRTNRMVSKPSMPGMKISRNRRSKSPCRS